MSLPPQREEVEILLVEDNPADVRLAKEALREGEIPSNLSCVSNGVEALAFLRQEGDFATAPRPDIILLDLNLPQIDGFAVLTEIKDDPDLRTIPVVVLTTSSNPDDILRAYELHASFYIKKPSDLDEFVNAMHSFDGFCLTVAQLPPRPSTVNHDSE
ncbi:MAG: response regulator [Planctomycetales bacterium]|nr:response regulator [Planctomycetales bacterium]